MRRNSVLLLYVLATWVWLGSNSQPAPSPQPDPMIIRQVVGKLEASEQKRIVGPNGLCMDVKYQLYFDGNRVQLWPCKSNADANQLWSLEADGTIRSNGKCLTIYGYSPSSYVMIYNCKTAVPDATRWQVWDNRTIINPRSGLVLTAVPETRRTVLTVMPNNYSTSQAWFPTYSSKPLLAYISGLKLCLQADGENVRLTKCINETASQKWYLYGDGSIRPYQYEKTCITTDGRKGNLVKIVTCDLGGSSGQRWYVKGDGIIWNLYYKRVLDVKNSDTVCGKIILWPFHGGDNQIWSVTQINN